MQFFKVKNLKIPQDYSLTNVGITQSLLSTWKTCRRKFLFTINRWERIEEDRFAYHSMMHYILEQLYKYGGKVSASQIIDKYKLPGSPKEVEELKTVASVMIAGYQRHYSKDFKEKRFESVEGKFAVQFGSYLLLGKKDGRFRDKMGGRWHIEHKNYVRINEDFLMQHLSFDLQNMFYALADLIEFKKPLNGVLYNIIRKPETKKERSNQELYKHIQQEIVKKPEHYYIRYEVPYANNDIEEFKHSLFIQLDELSKIIVFCKPMDHHLLNYFYKNESACDGKYQCPFLGACSTGNMCGYRQRAVLFPELV
jgi:hypothetical protein